MQETRAARAVALEDAVKAATRYINSLYPLTNFIACNSLKGLENTQFEEAMNIAGETFGARGFLPLSDYRAMYESGRITPSALEEAFHNRGDKHHAAAEICRPTIADMIDLSSGSNLVATINRQMIKWCSLYLDRNQSQWKFNEEESLFDFWRNLASHDHSMWWHGVKRWSQSVQSLPPSSAEALQSMIAEFGLEDEEIEPYLTREISQLPGFASHLKWREIENGQEGILTDYLAIRIHYERMLSRAACKKLYKTDKLSQVRTILESKPESPVKISGSREDYAAVWQEAYELSYRNRLLDSLALEPAQRADKACCQMVFCIDVRSEPLRRELEKRGPYSTYGFAGFFGIPMRFNELGSALSLDLCPVLIKPEKSVSESAEPARALKKISWQALKTTALLLKKKLKCSLSGAFGLVELFGFCSYLPLVSKTFFPSLTHKLRQLLERRSGGNLATELDCSAFSLEEKAALSEGALRGIGLRQFGKLIVLCGHKSSSSNNPFASSLDCGACGGNGGGYSARLLADILNDKNVRIRLASKSIEIPDDSIFVAAEHDTTTDNFSFFEVEQQTEEHSAILNQLKEDMRRAGEIVREKRKLTLPESGFEALNDPQARSCDWAQVAPEWGLAGNAAFIAGPRAMTRDADLEGRVFLHSYDCSDDADSKVLELIMTAPLVVAQWINMQYYLSTMDNQAFGSGSKVLHNVTGNFGVMQGAQSDLKIGLPLQSIRTADRLQHEPMRLLAIVRAPLSAVDKVLNKHPEVRQLVANRWIRLIALEPQTQEFFEADDACKWRGIQLPEKSSKKSEQHGMAQAAILAAD